MTCQSHIVAKTTSVIPGATMSGPGGPSEVNLQYIPTSGPGKYTWADKLDENSLVCKEYVFNPCEEPIDSDVLIVAVKIDCVYVVIVVCCPEEPA